MEQINTERSGRPKIVVLGGGFGGLAAIHALHGVTADLILVDRTNHFLFQPLLYQVATAALSPADIATATRAMFRRYDNLTIRMAQVVGIDPDSRIVKLEGGSTIQYDYLGAVAELLPEVSAAQTAAKSRASQSPLNGVAELRTTKGFLQDNRTGPE